MALMVKETQKVKSKLMLMLGFLAVSLTAEAQVYNNPVTDRSLPDPTIIRADDGSFYMFATEDTHNVPIMKSTDLVNWNYHRTAFTDATRPNFVKGAAIWAPDVNKVGDQYVLYMSMSKWGETWTNGIGVATSKRPWGPYSNAKKLFISNEIGVENCIDPFFYEEENGDKYLFFGSFHDIYVVKLTDDGLKVDESFEKKKVAGGLIEAVYIIKHDGYYYMVGSAGSCCEGEKSTYRLVVARSKNLLGPYYSRAGGAATRDSFTEILHGSDKVNGPGHCAEWLVDDNGQYWIIYHGFSAGQVDKGRLTYLDKVMWDKQGWPYIEGSIPSEESEVPYFNTSSIAAVESGSAYSVSKAEGLYQLLLESADNSPFSWQILSANGTMVKSGSAEHSINVWTTDLASGVYVVRISGKHGSYTQKLLL